MLVWLLNSTRLEDRGLKIRPELARVKQQTSDRTDRTHILGPSMSVTSKFYGQCGGIDLGMFFENQGRGWLGPLGSVKMVPKMPLDGQPRHLI